MHNKRPFSRLIPWNENLRGRLGLVAVGKHFGASNNSHVKENDWKEPSPKMILLSLYICGPPPTVG